MKNSSKSKESLVSELEAANKRIEELEKSQSEGKAATNNIEQDSNMIDWLAATTLELLKFPIQGDLYRFIGEKLQKLVPEALITVSKFDDITGETSPAALLGFGDKIDLVVKTLGYHPETISFKPPPELLDHISRGYLSEFPGDVFEITSGKIPKIAAKFIEKLFGFKHIYLMGFKNENRFFGNIVIMPFKNKKIENSSLIEAFVRQVAVALEQRRAVKDLNSKSALLEAQINSSLAGILVVDPDGKKILQNQRTVELWNIPQHIANNPDDNIQVQHVMSATKNPDKFVEKVKYLYNNPDETTHDEVELKNGTTLERYSAPVLGEDGKNYGRLWTFNDITELKQSEIRISLFSDILESSLNEVYLFDSITLKFTQVNRAAQNNLGYSMEEFKNLTAIDIKPELTIDSFAELVKPLRAGEKENLIFETVHQRKDGSLYNVEVHLQLISHDSENLFAAIILDITERKQAGKALRESEEKYRILFNSGNDSVFVHRPGGKPNTFIEVNDVACKTLGYTRQELLEMEPTEIAEKDPKNIQHVVNEIQSKGYAVFESIHIQKDGGKFPVEISTHKFEFKGKPTFISIARDVTERKKAEQELEKLTKLESLTLLGGGIAHNFKNILTNISLNISFAKYQPKKANEYLKKVEKSIDQATALASRFQTFSAGGDPIIEVISIEKVIVDSMKIGLKDSEIEHNLNFNEGLWKIKGDSKQLHEVFMNLIINSKQAMPKGGIIDIVVENISLEETNEYNLNSGNYVKVSFKDNGQGIAKKHIKKIFDPFYTYKVGGEGLGLTMALSIIKKHQGRIEANSERNLWTRFDIYLPAKR